MIFFYTLFYFPIKAYLGKREHFIEFLIIAAIALIINDLGQFYDYYSKLEEGGMQYAYQLAAAVRINQAIYGFTIISGIILFFVPQPKSTRILIFVMVALTTLALIITFSRTYWAIIIAELVILLIFFPLKYKVQLSLYIGTIAIVFVVLTNLFFGDISKVLYQVLENRFASTTQGKSDLSVETRLVEWKVAISKIEEYPLGGNGFAKKFPYYNPIVHSTFNSHIIHNGFLFIMHRVGIPMALMYFFCIIYFLLKSFITTLRLKDNFYRFISLSGFLGILALMVANMTSPLFTYRDGAFTVAFCFAFTELAYKYFIENEQSKESKILGFIRK
jgi:O-antigen ligase